jgi:hypothetical protein
MQPINPNKQGLGQIQAQYITFIKNKDVQGGSNMTGTNCDLFTHKLSRSYLSHLVVKQASALK